jgi:hypothetical protein
MKGHRPFPPYLPLSIFTPLIFPYLCSGIGFSTLGKVVPCLVGRRGSWWHSQEKGGLITSQPSHLREMLVGNVVTAGHQARTVSLSSSLEA